MVAIRLAGFLGATDTYVGGRVQWHNRLIFVPQPASPIGRTTAFRYSTASTNSRLSAAVTHHQAFAPGQHILDLFPLIVT